MSDYEFRYKLASAPEATRDGSGMVNHDVFAVAQDVDNGGWADVPGRHKTIQVPGAELTAALASGTNPEKVAAYKDALAANLNTQGSAMTGWSSAQLEALMDANDAASTAAAEAHAFILDVAGSYPVQFDM